MNTRNAVVLLAIGLVGFVGGCKYDAKEVEAFLRKPREPVTGVEYRVYPPDVLTIASQHVPEISGVSQQVRPDGKINLPLVGEIVVAGKTPKEIEESLVLAANKYYEQSDATVTIAGYNSQRYFVFGQVSSAGPRAWTGRDSLLDALCVAQPTNLAWPDRILIVRGGDPQQGGYLTTYPANFNKKQLEQYTKKGIHPETPGHPRHVLTINLYAMIETGDLSNNIYLMPNDVIYVQPNPFAKFGLALESVLYPVRPTLEAVRTPSALGNVSIGQ